MLWNNMYFCMPKMKRLTLYISVLWLVSMSLCMAVPEIQVVPLKQTQSEFGADNEEDKSPEIEISTASEAILSSFQFQAYQIFSLVPKLFIVAKIEKISPSFDLRDFKIFNWKVLFTKIIQVHGP